jgi:phosphotransferase system IIA component
MLGLKWRVSMKEEFQVRVSEGQQQIITGDLLAEFDADAMARKAKGPIVVVANHDGFHPTNPF